MSRFVLGSLLCCVLLLVSSQPSLSQASTTYPSVTAYLEAAKHTQFLGLAKALGLGAALDNAAFTVFVPTDKAFEAFFKSVNITDVGYLMDTFPVLDLVRYHVSPQALTLGVLPYNQKIQTFLKSPSSEKLRLTVDTKAVPSKTIIRGWESFATVVTADIQAGKSIVHVVDNVLLPRIDRDKGFYPFNLLDMMVFHGASYFQAAVGTVGEDFWNTLKLQETPVTVMMPTDKAFKAALAKLGKLDELKASGKLEQLVNYHIANGYGPSSRMVQGGKIQTWNPNSNWTFAYTPNGITVQGEKSNANIILKDSFTGMGSVVHVIDAVLLPKGF